ncbi:hypothetical protein Patl1_24905 [Pistacia atlantica]|uniref:Uncharacterized protein n=1 Tax=Pistacia atlantica TaxID=434234 RepID=A0ACC1B3D1_9ROSI|nr:hypothetical protein Patl1_24905 [Pistacia atlantica]
MEVSSKMATVTDTTKRFELPSKTLNHIHFPQNEFSVDLIFADRSGQLYTFSCRKRRTGRYPKPALRGEWLHFVRSKAIGVGDLVTFRKFDGGELGIEMLVYMVLPENTCQKPLGFKVFFSSISVWVDDEDASRVGVALRYLVPFYLVLLKILGMLIVILSLFTLFSQKSLWFKVFFLSISVWVDDEVARLFVLSRVGKDADAL